MSSMITTTTAPTMSASVDRGASYVNARPFGPLGQATGLDAHGTRMPVSPTHAGVELCPGIGRTAGWATFVVRDAHLRHLPSAVSGRGEPMI